MKADRPPVMGVRLTDQLRRFAESDRQDPLSAQIQADASDFEMEFSRSLIDEDDDASSEQDDSTPPKPFDLMPTIPFVSSHDVVAVPYVALAQFVQETVQAFYVSKDDTSRRQVSITLAENILPGVTLSVYEHDGRIVGDFTCVDEQSRDRLCEVAERMVSELANQLSRDARIYVRIDDGEDIYPFQVDATPEQNLPDKTFDGGEENSMKQGGL